MRKKLNFFAAVVLEVLVFLLPVFVLPGTISPLSLSKQVLLAGACFLLLVLWSIKTIVSGRLELVWDKSSWTIGLLMAVLAISVLFSGSPSQSFWGFDGETDAFFNFLLCGLTFLLFSNFLFEPKSVLRIIRFFLAGSGLVAALFLLQLFTPVFSWGFAQAVGFNLIGSIQDLAVFLTGSLVCLVVLAGAGQKLGKAETILLIASGILFSIPLLLIDYWASWLALALSAALFLFLAARQGKSAKNFALPLLLLITALFCFFVCLPFRDFIKLPAEINLSHKTSLAVAKQSWAQSAKNFILGSGPATFGSVFDLYKPLGINSTAFWQSRFIQGSSLFLTLAVSTGMSGVLCFLAIITVLVSYCFEALKDAFRPEALLFLPICLYFLVIWLFSPLNLVLLFVSFLMFGLFVAADRSDRARIEIDLIDSQAPIKTFGAMLVCGLVIAGSLAGGYKIGQKYRAGAKHDRGLSLLKADPPDLAQAIQNLSRAATLYENDIYFRDLSYVLLKSLKEQKIAEGEVMKKTALAAKESAIRACRINPLSSENWLQLAEVYENLIVFQVKDAESSAILSFERAGRLAPSNPRIPFSLARIYQAKAERITGAPDQAPGEELHEVQQAALKEVSRAIKLKTDFVPAYYLIARIYEAQGKKQLAIKVYKVLLNFEPDNENIKRKIQELGR